jgi:hypothetical protein
MGCDHLDIRLLGSKIIRLYFDVIALENHLAFRIFSARSVGCFKGLQCRKAIRWNGVLPQLSRRDALGLKLKSNIPLDRFISLALLHHMGQLVGQELLAGLALGVVLILSDEDVLAGRKGPRLDGAVQLVRAAVVVDPHAAEVGPERAFHRRAYGVRKRAPAAAQSGDAPFQRRRRGDGACGGPPLQGGAGGALLRRGRPPKRCDLGLALDRGFLCGRRAMDGQRAPLAQALDDLRSHTVGFLLISIACRSDTQLGLQGRGPRRTASRNGRKDRREAMPERGERLLARLRRRAGNELRGEGRSFDAAR